MLSTFWNSLCIKDLVNDVNNAAYVGNSLGFETEPICLESLLVKKWELTEIDCLLH